MNASHPAAEQPMARKIMVTTVQQRAASGRYEPPSDVVREALTLLEHREREAVIDEIRREIQLGIEQADAGQLRDGETAFAEIRKKLGLQP